MGCGCAVGPSSPLDASILLKAHDSAKLGPTSEGQKSPAAVERASDVDVSAESPAGAALR
jgi:hypothetical protein